eukprot:9973553-Prorocentrum_lima.AAC.1
MAKQEQIEGDTAPIALEDEYQDPEEEALPQSELINLDAEEDDDMSTPTIIPPSPIEPIDIPGTISMLSVAYALQKE